MADDRSYLFCARVEDVEPDDLQPECTTIMCVWPRCTHLLWIHPNSFKIIADTGAIAVCDQHSVQLIAMAEKAGDEIAVVIHPDQSDDHKTLLRFIGAETIEELDERRVREKIEDRRRGR